MNNLISKIEIHNFRSFEKIILPVKEINIFSGINDVGKSNILKALNLFFNGQTDFLKPLKFEDDYNKVARARMIRSSKMKQLIKIRIFINPPPTYQTLATEDNLYIERQFDRNGFIIERFSTKDDIKKKASIKRLINKIRYIYIPALKGEEVLQYLLSLIGEQQLISDKDISSLNESIARKTNDLKDILEKSGIDISTTFGLPTLLSDFWQKLSVKTQYEEFEKLESDIKGSNGDRGLNPSQFSITLLNRGEGIKSKYIPPLLQWLDKNDKSKMFIWGIDEPENSLEFDLADKLARLYFNEYALNNQIFITSHSLAFINPPKDIKIKPKRFKFLKDSFGRTQWQDLDDLFEKQNTLELMGGLGILLAQKEFIEEYRKITKEKDELETKITQYVKPILIVEGKTDKWIIEKSWAKLFPSIDIPFEIYPSGLYLNINESEGNADQVKRTIELSSPMINNDKIIIGLFDNDREGNEKFSGLNQKIFEKYRVNKFVRKHKTKNIYGLLLPVPDNRKIYVGNKITQRFLEIEHYFSDTILQENKLKGEKVAPDSQIFTIRNKHKTRFARERVNNIDSREFDNFRSLFEKINEIIEQSS